MSIWRWKDTERRGRSFLQIGLSQSDRCRTDCRRESGNCAAFNFSGFEYKDLRRMYFTKEQLTKVARNAIIMLLK